MHDQAIVKAAEEGRLCELVEMQDLTCGDEPKSYWTAVPRNFSFNKDSGYVESPIEVCPCFVYFSRPSLILML
jgi:hypothetical protein